jgi:hypothetical protein
MSEPTERPKYEYTADYFKPDMRKQYEDHIYNTAWTETNRIPQWVLSALLASKAEHKTDDEERILKLWDDGELETYSEDKDIDTIVGALQAKERIVQQDKIEKWIDSIPGVSRDTAKAVNDLLNNTIGKIDNWVLEQAETLNMLPDDMVEQLREFSDDGSILTSGAVILFGALALTQTLGAYGTRTAKEIERNLNTQYRPDIPGWNDIIQSALYDDNAREVWETLLGEWGIPEKYIPYLIDNARSNLSLSEIFTLRRRDEIDDTAFNNLLRRTGMRPVDVERVKPLLDNIPPIQDIITMAVREAWNDEVIDEFELDRDFPSQVADWAEKLGYSRDWALKYWISHWTLPSVTQGFEMLHRELIDNDQLENLLRAQDIPPFWRDNLIKMSHRLYTRVDIRRMYREGVLDEQGVFEELKHIGYDEERARNMTDFYISWTTGEEKEPTRGKIIKAYKQGVIDERDVKEKLKNLEYSDDAVDLYVSLADYELEEEYLDTVIDVTEAEYQNGGVDAETAREKLREAGVRDERIDILLNKWELNRISNTKIPSKADLQKFLKQDIITLEEFRHYMSIEGYADDVIDMYLTLLEE